MVHLGAHAVFCRLHGPCPGGIRRRYGSEAHDGAADARRPDGSTIRDSAARAAIPPRVPAIPPRSLAPDLWHDGCTARRREWRIGCTTTNRRMERERG